MNPIQRLGAVIALIGGTVAAFAVWFGGSAGMGTNWYAISLIVAVVLVVVGVMFLIVGTID